MKKLLLAAIGALGLVVAMAGVANAAPPMPEPGSPYGYYITVDGDRVHLRTTDPGADGSVYTGTITTDGDIRGIELAREEDGDWAVAGGDTLQFHFFTANHVDGVSFTALGASRVTFRLFRDGHPIRTDHIFLGGDGFNPHSNPFVLFI